MLSFATAQYAAGSPELVMIDQESTATPYTLASRRQTSGATIDKLTISVQPTDRGILGQISFYRSSAGQGIRLRTSNGVTIATTPNVGADNDQSVAGLKMRAGVIPGFSPSPAGNGGACKWKLYRMFIENLARSGRDPIAVLDSDWDRQQARIVASVAANGGTSLIFN